MPIKEFTILLDNPTKSYYPGNPVYGRVVVDSPLEIRTLGLKVKCYGLAKVCFKEPYSRNKYEYKATENYFKFKKYLVQGNGHSAIIPPGRNEYPFKFLLPTTPLPCNWEGKHGKVIYEVLATLKRSYNLIHLRKVDKVAQKTIFIKPILHLDPTLVSRPVTHKCKKHLGFWKSKSGPLGFEISLAKTGFIPGEVVSPIVRIFNESDSAIKYPTLSLIQKVCYFTKSDTKTKSKTLCELRGPRVGSCDVNVSNPVLKIPKNAPPTNLGGCGIIGLQYFLHFELHLPVVAISLKEEIPVMIGTL